MMTDTGDWVLTYTFDADPTLETMDEWGLRLESLDGSVARIPDRGIDVTVYAPASLSIPDAIAKTIGDVTYVVQIGAPIGIEVVTEQEHSRRADAPTMPELMSAAEIADELGIARQRVHQLRRNNVGFPDPLAELRGGAVWDAIAVRKFKEEWDRRPGRPRVGLQGLARQEREACLIAERSLGAVAEAWDVGGRQGAVDAMLTLPDGRRAAFEVTNLAAKGALYTASILARDNHTWRHPGKWFWTINVGSAEDLERLRNNYDKIILLCEAAGEPYPERRLGWDPAADPELQWLVQSSSTMWGNPDIPAQGRGAMVVPAAGGGFVDETLAGFAAELGKAFESRHIASHFHKLAEADTEERHLFIALHDSALPFNITSGLTFGETLPCASPPVPDFITHLWLAPAFSRRVLLWSRTKGWDNLFPYESELAR